MLDSPAGPPEVVGAEPPRMPLLMRLISGTGGVLVFLTALVVSVVAAVAAPIGMLLVHRWTGRRSRRPSRVASICGAVLASSVAAAIVWGAVFTLTPRRTQQEFISAMTAARNQPPPKLPAWYGRVFPQPAGTDSATQRLLQSPEFVTGTLALSFIFMALLFGALGGGLGWCGATLIAWAWSGRRAA
jgi:MFS family permease